MTERRMRIRRWHGYNRDHDTRDSTVSGTLDSANGCVAQPVATKRTPRPQSRGFLPRFQLDWDCGERATAETL